MRAINYKLIRDLWHVRGMALAIALVMICGVATYVMSRSTLDALTTTLDEFYEDYRFAEIFAVVKRAPESVATRVEQIRGVEVVDTRVIAGASLDIEGYGEPVQAQLISLPDEGESRLNLVYIVDGRNVEPYKGDEVVVSDAFAEAHGFRPGDEIRAVINGRRKTLIIVGIARSPEYIYQLAPGSIIPDFARFGILWMGRSPLATAFDMEGAFNDLSLTLTGDANAAQVVEELDLVLRSYGGLGAYGRDDQQSHFYITEELRQLDQMATIFPIIFLGVAAFLLNVVVNRLVQTQREQIAVLKAFGYSNFQIAVHFMLLVCGVLLMGVIGGLALGIRFGQGLAQLYTEFYRFPWLNYELNADVVVTALGVSALAAAVGTVAAVRRAAMLPPAEAMRPEPPASYRESVLEKMFSRGWLGQPTRMIIRHLSRHPVKAALAVTGIAAACALLLMGQFFSGATDYMIEIQFRMAQRDDLTVTFNEPTSYNARHSMDSIEGVDYTEVFRASPVRLRNGHKEYRSVIQGIQPRGDLFRLLNTDLSTVEVPPAGILLPPHLASILEIESEDTLVVEFLEGRRPVRSVIVAGLIEQYIGLGAYMHIDALNRLLGEGSAISGAFLAVDQMDLPAVNESLKDIPRVAGVSNRMQAIDDFYDNMGETMLVFAFFYTLFAGAISFAIIYNSARIALSERGRELASLRILGFRQSEISYILLGELAILTLIAIPVGFVLGWGLCVYIVMTLQTELIRFPFVMTGRAYSFSALVIVGSAILTALIIRRRLYKLDLITVLKTRE